MFLHLPTKEICEPQVVAEGRGMHVDVDAHSRGQQFRSIADGSNAGLIHGRLRLLAPDIIKQYVSPLKVGTSRTANQGLNAVDGFALAFNPENGLKNNA